MCSRVRTAAATAVACAVAGLVAHSCSSCPRLYGRPPLEPADHHATHYHSPVTCKPTAASRCRLLGPGFTSVIAGWFCLQFSNLSRVECTYLTELLLELCTYRACQGSILTSKVLHTSASNGALRICRSGRLAASIVAPVLIASSSQCT